MKQFRGIYGILTSAFREDLELDEEGAQKFSDATEELAPSNGIISIWMDETLISYPQVNTHITDGRAVITGNFTAESATELASKINAGALPFKLQTENFRSIDPDTIPHKISGPIGCDTTAILKELGYDDEKIKSMYDEGDIR